MAELRLIQEMGSDPISGVRPLFLLIAALAACQASEANPGSGITAPAGWQALPSVAKAAGDAAKASGISVDGTEAWGETARGCYAAWIALHGGAAAPTAMADQLVLAVQSEPTMLGILVHDVVKPAAGAKSGVLSLGFERGVYRGMLHASLVDDGHIAALACFWNQREPGACEEACKNLVGSLK
jgi:hypothetical protein